MGAAADVFARRFFESCSRPREFPPPLQLAENKKALSKRSGPRGMGAGPNSRQSSVPLPAVRSRRSPISMPATINLWKEVVCSILHSVGLFPARPLKAWPAPLLDS